jgi:DNA-binding MarR family transcriptional regulator
LADFLGANSGRDEALYVAYKQGGLTMSQIALQSGLSLSRISRIVSALEAASDGLEANGMTLYPWAGLIQSAPLQGDAHDHSR